MTRTLSLRAPLPAIALLTLLLPGLAGCGARDEGTARAAGTPAVESADGASDKRARTAMRVRVARAEQGALERSARTTGVVYADRKAEVAAEVAGRVVERAVEAGARVEAGDVLVALDTTLLALAESEARATLEARRVDLAEAQKERTRATKLAKRGAMSQSQLDSARFAVDRARSAHALAEAALGRASRALADASVRAPFTGTVEQVMVDVGDYAQPGSQIATIADFGRVRVRAGITAAEAADVEEGQPATVEFADLGGERFAARVNSVGRVADRSGTYRVEVWLDEADARLREGMVAQLQLIAGAETGSLLVPRSALLRRADGLSVFVVDERGEETTAVARRVRVGRSGVHDAEILEGLDAGERVVTDGLFALRDGARILVDSNAAREDG